MKDSPGRVTQSRIALLPSGQLAEAALDSSKTAWARWYDGSTRTAWALVASGVIDVSVTAASINGTDAVYVVATPGAPSVGQASGGRRIRVLTRDGTLADTGL